MGGGSGGDERKWKGRRRHEVGWAGVGLPGAVVPEPQSGGDVFTARQLVLAACVI